jgi:hypothetical protein
MNFGTIRRTIYFITSIFLAILEIILKALYMLIPVGVFMALIQFREQISKANAIGTFTSDDSTFQLIHPNFILVCVNPKKLKLDQKKMLKEIDKFYDKYKSVIILGSIFIFLLLTYVGVILR